MKNLSGTRLFIAVAALAVAALLGFQAFAQRPTPKPNPAFVLTINQLTDTKIDQAGFEAVLNQLQTDQFELYTINNDGKCKKHTKGKKEDCTGTPTPSTSSGTAMDDRFGELTYIQHRTTIQVPTMYSSDIRIIADQLK